MANVDVDGSSSSPDPTPLIAYLRRAAPDQQVEAADEYIRTRLNGLRADVLLADYRIAGLWSVLEPGHPNQGSLAERTVAARCFSSQQSMADPLSGGGVRLHVPLTAWGERVGVLVVDLAEPPPGPLVDRYLTVAADLAVAIRAADRDTDRYRRTRRRERLSMAAELQWEMVPGRSVNHEAYLLAGQLEPAYTVGGDNFDWAVNGDRLTVTALNGAGTGLPASMLTALAVNAMRNARRSGGSLVEQAELASDTIFAEHRGARHLATLLLEFDARTGRALAVDAGSPRAVRVRGAEAVRIGLEEQLPLGMFDDTRYEVQEFLLEPGDRLFIISDGVYAATPNGKETYGQSAMYRSMRATRLQPATEAVGSVMRELHDYHEQMDLEDDAVIVCLDWRGMEAGPMGSSVTHTES